MNVPDREHPLPLTEHRETQRTIDHAAAASISDDEALIRRVVDSFYRSIRTDDILGPIFAAKIDDWSKHLPKMYDFWSSIVLRSGRYSGRPIMAHLKLEGITPAHFERWLGLWRETVEREAPPGAQRAFINAAERMAANMRAAMLGDE